MITDNAAELSVTNIHAAKTNLSRLIEQALRGEVVVIGKAGVPLVKLVPFDAPTGVARKRLGFLAGAFEAPDAATFRALGREEIAAMFGGEA